MTTHLNHGTPLPKSQYKRLFLVLFGMLQITLGAGLIVGWAGIAGSMLLISESPLLSLDDLTTLYSFAASANYIAPLFLGTILDKFGPRACSAVANGFVTLGCFLFASANTFTSFAIGLCFIGLGGPGVQTSLIHLGNLFPTKRFFVMGMVAETITLSFAIFPLMDVIWANTDLSFRDIFRGLGGLLLCSTICSLLLWPDSPYEVVNTNKDCNDEDDATNHRRSEEEEELVAAVKQQLRSEAPVNQIEKIDLQHQSFQNQISSGVFIRLSLFFLVTSFWANFYIATVTTELGDQQRFDAEEQHALAEQLSFIDAGAILCAPLSGYLLDSVGFKPTAIVTIGLGIFQQLFLLVAGKQSLIMIASFVCYAVFRAFLFPYFFASLSKRMGFRFFGILSGLSFFVSGLCQFAIAPLAMLVEGTCHEFHNVDGLVKDCSEGNWTIIHTVQIATLVGLLLIPFLDAQAEQSEETEASLHTPKSSPEYGSLDSLYEQES